ncbi:MAG: Gfo/Idh/MocA family oxidoreductase [Victivallaceae bacterium]|nr:Gfo/Idh/MocA family oxidoreductase [Victivallaceae bacterium]
MEKVRVGIIGLGFMGTTHFGIHQANPKAQVVAVADIDKVKLTGNISAVVGNIGTRDSDQLDFSGIKTYENALDLINSLDVDMVDICVPTFLHKKFALAAIKAGKHVFLEKPFSRNLDEVKEIAAAARASDKNFNVGMCVRAWPEYFDARTRFKAGEFGALKSANFRRLSPSVDGNSWENWFMNNQRSGSAILDLHMHDIDLVRFFFGKPRAVNAFGLRGFRSDDGIDHVLARYDFGDGTLVSAEGGWAGTKSVPFEMSFQLICEKATVRFMSEGYKIYWENGEVESPEVGDATLPTGWHQELAYFVNCILDGSKPEKYQKLDELVDSFKMYEAELAAIESGKTVTINY